MRPETRQTVLLIEADTSLRRLIALGLQYRDMHVIEASSPANLPALDTVQPGLIVLDVDGEVGNTPSLLTSVQENARLAALPIVVLAWECSPQAEITCLVKPFDARALYPTIEQALVTHSAAVNTGQEVALATQSATPASSIWPLVTAAGLLVAVIGFMINLGVSGVGLLIVVIALLCWTLGTQPEPQLLTVEMSKTYPAS
jgi:DNA-binding NtrC family response regulator